MSSDADRNRPPLISVAICTRNRARLLSGAVESVLSQLDCKTQLTIIDNGSTDETPALLAEFARRNPMVRSYLEPRLGIGHARNSAMVNSPGDWVLFLDDDDTAEPGWLAAYRSFLESPPSANIAVVGGRIIPNYETTPPRWWTKGDGGLDLGPLPRRFESRAGPWSCNAAYRRDAVQKIGGFNPSLGRKGAFYGAHEESDVYIRLLEAGYEAWYLPEARILHLIQGERLRAAWHCRTEYAQGRSAAIMRGARCPSPTSHLFFSLRHTVVGVLHITLLILATVVTLPFAHGRRSIRSLTRALRKAGFIRQLWTNQLNPERRL
jgi:glucosyl-dolichyl phosphate glucuronosyltransferase